MKKRVRFIINPKSGVAKKDKFEEWIRKTIDSNHLDPDIRYTERPQHATVLAEEAVADDFDAVIAIGGDGSVNETASALKGTKTALGIIPTGSGNGMARHLRIPMDFKKAVKVINKFNTICMDTMTANQRFCIGTIGVGFDAHIAHLFSKTIKRGYSTYVKLVLTEFRSFPSKRFSILVDGKTVERDCWLLTFANSSQFGNNFMIAPFADVCDGRIDISIMKKFPVWVAPSLINRMLKNKLGDSRYFEGIQAKSIRIDIPQPLLGHIDGEPVIFENELQISIEPLSLNVIVPD